jgi:hypothetical protein
VEKRKKRKKEESKGMGECVREKGKEEEAQEEK